MFMSQLVVSDIFGEKTLEESNRRVQGDIFNKTDKIRCNIWEPAGKDNEDHMHCPDAEKYSMNIRSPSLQLFEYFF